MPGLPGIPGAVQVQSRSSKKSVQKHFFLIFPAPYYFVCVISLLYMMLYMLVSDNPINILLQGYSSLLQDVWDLVSKLNIYSIIGSIIRDHNAINCLFLYGYTSLPSTSTFNFGIASLLKTGFYCSVHWHIVTLATTVVAHALWHIVTLAITVGAACAGVL